MKKRRRIDPDDVLEKINEIGQELGTPPPQAMLAESLRCSQGYMSRLFMALEYAGRIEWISRYAYRVPGAQWTPPRE